MCEIQYMILVKKTLLLHGEYPFSFSHLPAARTDQQAEGEGGSGSSQEEDHILSPKIFFTPDNPCTRSIVHRANRTFAVAGILVDWSHSIANCSAYLLRNDTRSTIITVSLLSLSPLLLLSLSSFLLYHYSSPPSFSLSSSCSTIITMSLLPV